MTYPVAKPGPYTKRMNHFYHLALLQNLSFLEFLMIILTLVFWVVPAWMIFKKAGYHPALGLLILIPFVNIILIYFLAFSRWPIHRR